MVHLEVKGTLSEHQHKEDETSADTVLVSNGGGTSRLH